MRIIIEASCDFLHMLPILSSATTSRNDDEKFLFICSFGVDDVAAVDGAVVVLALAQSSVPAYVVQSILS
jgi:hypothetical protein